MSKTSAVAMGGEGGRAPPNDFLCPAISVYSEYFFEASDNDKTTDNAQRKRNNNNGKRNNNVQRKFSFEILSILCKISGNQLLHVNGRNNQSY